MDYTGMNADRMFGDVRPVDPADTEVVRRRICMRHNPEPAARLAAAKWLIENGPEADKFSARALVGRHKSTTIGD